MSIKDTFDSFWKYKWIFTQLWEKEEDSWRTSGAEQKSSPASAEVCSAPCAGRRDSLHLCGTALRLSVNSASLHSSPATSAASALQLQHKQRMAAAKTEMILPALQISEPLSFPHSPMDNYPKLEEVMMLSSAGTPFLTASAPEGAGFGSGEPGEQYDHLAGGKNWRFISFTYRFSYDVYKWKITFVQLYQSKKRVRRRYLHCVVFY